MKKKYTGKEGTIFEKKQFKLVKGSSRWSIDDPTQNLSLQKRVLVCFGSTDEIFTNPTIKLQNKAFVQNVAFFMIDTECELNLIKESVVNSGVGVNRIRIYDLVGIGLGIIKSLGEIMVEIEGIESAFQIIPEDFSIEQNGILGTSFLGNHRAISQLLGITHHLGNPLNSNFKIKLSARSNILTAIPISRTDLNQGYIGKINAAPGIYLGEALVTKNGNFAKCYAINSTNQDIELSLSPIVLQGLQEYTVVSPCARTGTHPPSASRDKRNVPFALLPF